VVKFIDNTASSGGGMFSSFKSLTFDGNSSVLFANNNAMQDGESCLWL